MCVLKITERTPLIIPRDRASREIPQHLEGDIAGLEYEAGASCDVPNFGFSNYKCILQL